MSRPADPLNLRFPGQYYQAETGLNQNYFRDYDPAVGRYVESDPIGLRGGINTYAYADGNPISEIDPLGLFDWPSIPQPALDLSMGVADSVSFGLGALARNAAGYGGEVNRCSTAYKVGEYGSLALGGLRAAYAGGAKLVSAFAANGAEAVAGRNLLKQAFRGPLFWLDYRLYTYEQMLAEKGTDAAVQAAAGHTSAAWNALGFDAAAGGAANSASCGCN